MNTIIIVISLYIVLFIGLCRKNQQNNWLLASLFLWMFFSFLGALLLPNILGITKINSLLQPYFYITLSSIFFFSNNMKWDKIQKVFCVNSSISAFLAYWAICSIIMHFAYIILLLLAYWHYPQGLSFFTFLSLLQYYFLSPVFWIFAHLSLIGIMMMKHSVDKNAAVVISIWEFKLIFFIFLLFSIAYLAYDVQEFVTNRAF